MMSKERREHLYTVTIEKDILAADKEAALLIVNLILIDKKIRGCGFSIKKIARKYNPKQTKHE